MERFWSKVDCRSREECWPWLAGRNIHGYGKFWFHGREHNASRIAYLLTFGAIPDGRYVCHHCDTPVCCNPAHLYAGTPRDNQQDKVRKGRGNFRLGEMSASSKLTNAEVREMRRLHAAGYATQKELALVYGVDPSTVSLIMNYKIRRAG